MGPTSLKACSWHLGNRELRLARRGPTGRSQKVVRTSDVVGAQIRVVENEQSDRRPTGHLQSSDVPVECYFAALRHAGVEPARAPNTGSFQVETPNRVSMAWN